MQQFKSDEQRAFEEFARRVGGEVEKALQKYGEIALVPAGHPDYDIFDYLINELVGMQRYGEMVIARANLMQKLDVIDRATRDGLVAIGGDAMNTSVELGIRLIMARQSMQDDGLMLGTPEKSYGAVSEDTVRDFSKKASSYQPRRSIFPNP